jgi:molecular chaperone DnaJ
MAEAALGVGIVIPTLDGEQRLKVPESIQSGETLRLRGKGAPHLNAGGCGDLIVHIEVRTPVKLNKEQRALMEQLRATLPEGGRPAEKTLLDKLKDYLM